MSGDGTRLVELLERALPALRISADMAKSDKSKSERKKLVREVEAALAPCSEELLFLLNDAVKLDDRLEVVDTIWREGKRRVELGQSGSKELALITAYIVVQLPALLSEVRRLRRLLPASNHECSNAECEDGILFDEHCGQCQQAIGRTCPDCKGAAKQ